jgi:hypothetical protein
MKNKSTLKLSVLLIVFCLCIVFPNLVNAQDKNIFEISENTSLHSNDRQEFYNLAFNLNTTIYLKDNMVKNTYGDDSFIRITMKDTESFDIIKNNQNQYKQIEIITIQVKSLNELSKTVDLTTLTEMDSLKYIFIKCYFKCQNNDIKNFIKTNPNVRIFYSAQMPS